MLIHVISASGLKPKEVSEEAPSLLRVSIFFDAQDESSQNLLYCSEAAPWTACPQWGYHECCRAPDLDGSLVFRVASEAGETVGECEVFVFEAQEVAQLRSQPQDFPYFLFNDEGADVGQLNIAFGLERADELQGEDGEEGKSDWSGTSSSSSSSGLENSNLQSPVLEDSQFAESRSSSCTTGSANLGSHSISGSGQDESVGERVHGEDSGSRGGPDNDHESQEGFNTGGSSPSSSASSSLPSSQYPELPHPAVAASSRGALPLPLTSALVIASGSPVMGYRRVGVESGSGQTTAINIPHAMARSVELQQLIDKYTSGTKESGRPRQPAADVKAPPSGRAGGWRLPERRPDASSRSATASGTPAVAAAVSSKKQKKVKLQPQPRETHLAPGYVGVSWPKQPDRRVRQVAEAGKKKEEAAERRLQMLHQKAEKARQETLLRGLAAQRAVKEKVVEATAAAEGRRIAHMKKQIEAERRRQSFSAQRHGVERLTREAQNQAQAWRRRQIMECNRLESQLSHMRAQRYQSVSRGRELPPKPPSREVEMAAQQQQVFGRKLNSGYRPMAKGGATRIQKKKKQKSKGKGKGAQETQVAESSVSRSVNGIRPHSEEKEGNLGTQQFDLEHMMKNFAMVEDRLEQRLHSLSLETDAVRVSDEGGVDLSLLNGGRSIGVGSDDRSATGSVHGLQGRIDSMRDFLAELSVTGRRVVDDSPLREVQGDELHPSPPYMKYVMKKAATEDNGAEIDLEQVFSRRSSSSRSFTAGQESRDLHGTGRDRPYADGDSLPGEKDSLMDGTSDSDGEALAQLEGRVSSLGRLLDRYSSTQDVLMPDGEADCGPAVASAAALHQDSFMGTDDDDDGESFDLGGGHEYSSAQGFGSEAWVGQGSADEYDADTGNSFRSSSDEVTGSLLSMLERFGSGRGAGEGPSERRRQELDASLISSGLIVHAMTSPNKDVAPVRGSESSVLLQELPPASEEFAAVAAFLSLADTDTVKRRTTRVLKVS
jgi:hypothetical protein